MFRRLISSTKYFRQYFPQRNSKFDNHTPNLPSYSNFKIYAIFLKNVEKIDQIFQSFHQSFQTHNSLWEDFLRRTLITIRTISGELPCIRTNSWLEWYKKDKVRFILVSAFFLYTQTHPGVLASPFAPLKHFAYPLLLRCFPQLWPLSEESH